MNDQMTARDRHTDQHNTSSALSCLHTQVVYPKPTDKPLYKGLVTQAKALAVPLLSWEEIKVRLAFFLLASISFRALSSWCCNDLTSKHTCAEAALN